MTSSRVIPKIVIAAVAVLAVAFYFLSDPAISRFAPKCIFYVATGLQCPGCGSQRMFHALLHGDLASAWGYNAVLLCLLPLLVVMAFSAATRKTYPRLYASLNSVPMIIALGTLVVGWGVIRNFI